MNIDRVVRAGRWKKKEKDRTGKKSQKGYNSPIWGEASTEAVYIKNCDVLAAIMSAKFQDEIFRGYDFTGGRFFNFAINC